ncbi:Histidinol-phosphate/aromatic aminotransferase or cobyric acid decarboxylase [Butyrivibrio sp. INlla14]|nr:Histidinol-phosphate/aromatic aminotransferase or cobyric acid decarboxylase [Butyrivibrio sp. INlla14]
MLHGGEIYDKKIKYDFSVNTNPFPCPEDIKDMMIETVFAVDKYPDIAQSQFRRAVAKALNSSSYRCVFSPDMIIGGNGASELIAAVTLMLQPRKVLLPVPSFWGYEHALGMLESCEINYYPLSKENDFELTKGIVDAIEKDTDAVFLANPNNPTGRCISRDVLEKILERCQDTGTKLIIDECFFSLSEGNTSARDYIRDYSELYVIDAYTKLFSIPGVRVGFLLSQSQNIQNIKRYLPEWNMSSFALVAGVGCAKHCLKGYTDESMEYIRRERTFLEENLKKCGIKVFKSDTNFLLLYSDENLYSYLLEKEILIRDCSNFRGLKKGYFRVAVKTHEENKILIKCLREQ